MNGSRVGIRARGLVDLCIGGKEGRWVGGLNEEEVGVGEVGS